MIDLTPLEVRQKKGDFRRGFRGYDAELVNDFLDLVADRMEELVKENMALSDSVEALEQELADYRDKEAALSDALMAAQKLREDARNHAEKEGELLIREARSEAEEARQQVSRSLAREEETLRQVRARRAQLVASFRRLLEREISELAVIEEALELEGEPAASATRVQPPAADVAAVPPETDPETVPAETGSAEGAVGEGLAPAEERTEGRREDAGGGSAEAEPKAAEGASEDEQALDEDDTPSSDIQEDWLQSLNKE